MRFRGKTLNSVRFRIPPDGNFGEVLSTFNQLQYPHTGVASEQITFAILELLSNSLRAHRDRAVNQPVLVELYVAQRGLLVKIIDRGGGFDPQALPYDLMADVHRVNLMSAAFEEYRRRFDNSRFGMGLIATRKVFPGFKLYFVDDSMQTQSWPSAGIVGTVVELHIPIQSAAVFRSREHAS